MGGSVRPRPLAGIGAACAAAAVALSAYAVHGAEGEAQMRLQTAAMYAFGHGVALAVLATTVSRRTGRLALAILLLGMLLFCGSLAGNALLGWPTAAAPFGGVLLIAGWLLLAIDFLRR
ncbi:DUF423 domain-containing protein [Luteimonas sp. R10]|uniref:DUF423 domain-containing protein n=1 Tax=Luteimonas sp. R10 TaxID=3108176 RepID=UPI00308DBAD0|nr:DUF423 domain-containing protein [Luteimonas sp. R10]